LCNVAQIQDALSIMKIPITDQLLWDMYSIFEKTGKMRDFIMAPRHRKLDVWLDLENPIFRKYKNAKNRRRFSNAIYYLKKKNLIQIQSLQGKSAAVLTKGGISKALKASFICSDVAKRKDDKWIMIIFDVPRTHRRARNLLKSILYNLGYKLLQQSVWVTPYDVFDKTEHLLQIHSLDRYIKIFLIEKV